MLNPEGRITFTPLTVLRLDGEVIDTDNGVSPTALHNFIIASTDTIATYVDRTYQRDILKAKNPETKERIIIHAARLAMHEFDRSVIEGTRQQEVEAINLLPGILTPEAREYWDAVAATSFRPEIHVRGIKAQEGTSGVWLSLKTPK